MIRHLSILLLVLAPTGCFESAAPSCTVSCVTSADCPSDLLCASDGKCSTDGEVCVPVVNSCTAGEFLTCVGTQAQVCNQNGDGANLEECGSPGCNAVAGRCNTCAPTELSCGNNGELLACGADGVAMTTVETCSLGCEPGTAPDAPRCRTLEPVWMPDVCDTPATEASLAITSSMAMDTGTDTLCNGGILDQPVGRQICVIRYGAISLTTATLTVTGSRVLALVADNALDIDGTLDISASGTTNGPGGGFILAGARVIGPSGGGGGGFRTMGASGGDGDGTGVGVGGLGGGVVNPLTLNNISGGARSEAIPPLQQMTTPFGGGGGGAGLLVSCRGIVNISGTIDAGGGGGRGGFDANGIAGGTEFKGGASGGAGGYVVIQGAGVLIGSAAGLYANGGAGGGGVGIDGFNGAAGADGPRAVAAAIGGTRTGTPAGIGGNGGFGTSAPTAGQAGVSAGGGGGSAGRFQIYTPMSGTPMIDAAATFSPPRDADAVVPTR